MIEVIYMMLKELRKQNNLTQVKCAEYLGLPLRTYQNYENMVYFVRDGVKIGASQYCTYKSEDGKCFILDFWVFPEYRGNGTGHKCFQTLMEYTKNDGAIYYALNYAKEDSHRFWASLGFSDNGTDEYGSPLMIKRNCQIPVCKGNCCDENNR